MGQGRRQPGDAGGADDAVLIGAGQTQTLSGVVRDTLDLGAGALLTEPAGGWLAVFGPIIGPGSGTATIAVAAGATLYAAGAIGPGIAAAFTGAGGTLALAPLMLPQMAAAIAGFAAGEVIDFVSGTITEATIVGSGRGALLTLSDEGTTLGTLTLADTLALGGALYAIPDAIDGTRLLLGPAMPATTGTVAAGTAGGTSFVWAGGGSGQWSSATAWRTAGGGAATTAPGAHDIATLTGPSSSVLSVAGNAAAATLATSGLVALAGSFALGTLLVGATALDALVLTAGATVSAGGVALQAGVLQVAAAGAALVVAGTVSVASGTLWVADGGRVAAKTLSLAGGTVRLDAAGAIALGGAAASPGAVAMGAGGMLSGSGAVRAPIANGGTVQASGGVLAIYGAVTGIGLEQITAGATLYLPYGAAAGQSVAFLPGTVAGTLELFGTASLCAATITGFGVGDVIDIAGATFTQATWAPGAGSIGTLDLGQFGTLSLGLAAGLAPGQASFRVTPDGVGGSQVVLVPCFCPGAMLATPAGERAVEALAPGDLVLTRSGGVRRIGWIGRRAYSAAMLRRHPQLRPVRIRADALGPGLPRRDLRLSPQHGLALPTPAGLRLVPAVALVDGVRIAREPADRPACYLHLELDRHDLLLVENIAAESFLASGGERRSLFRATRGVAADGQAACLPRLQDGPLLAALRRSLGLHRPAETPTRELRGHLDSARLHAEQVRLDGWAFDTGRPGEPVRLAVLLDGVPAAEVIANLWRPDLDRSGLAGGACGFMACLPAGLCQAAQTLSLEAG